MIMELMKYNFIIVQHFAPLDMAEQCEGNRLRSFYNVESFPYIAIINPLTGGEVKRMSRIEYSDVDRFAESSMRVALF